MMLQFIQRQFWVWSLSLVLVLTGCLGFGVKYAEAVPLIAQTGTVTPQTSDPQASDTAEAIFRAAYANRYTWDEEFPGYAAEVRVRDGDVIHQGKIHLLPDFAVTVENVGEDEIRQLIAAQLQMSATHLRSVPFEQLHRHSQFEQMGVDATGAVKIEEIGDESSSSYKVKDQQIQQVNRTLGDFKVEVNTIDSMQTPKGYLPTRFQVIFRDAATGEVLERDDVRDAYTEVNGYYFLSKREARTGVEERSFNKLLPDTVVDFSNIALDR
ncbi:MAG TPA: DUF3386 family protein [Trichocoleus sp.]|jgi:hypothetical protein